MRPQPGWRERSVFQVMVGFTIDVQGYNYGGQGLMRHGKMPPNANAILPSTVLEKVGEEGEEEKKRFKGGANDDVLHTIASGGIARPAALRQPKSPTRAPRIADRAEEGGEDAQRKEGRKPGKDRNQILLLPLGEARVKLPSPAYEY